METPSGAIFSECRRYRYVLWRKWQPEKPQVLFIGLNPSLANEYTDDPTLRRMVGFAKSMNYGCLLVVNLFPCISPKPKDIIFSENQNQINQYWIHKTTQKCEKIIFAWGAHKAAKEIAKSVTNKYEGYVLGLNKNGSPKHPLYLNKQSRLIPFYTSQIQQDHYRKAN